MHSSKTSTLSDRVYIKKEAKQNGEGKRNRNRSLGENVHKSSECCSQRTKTESVASVCVYAWHVFRVTYDRSIFPYPLFLSLSLCFYYAASKTATADSMYQYA